MSKDALCLYACHMVSPNEYGWLPCVYDKFFVLRTLLAAIDHMLSNNNSNKRLETGLESLWWLVERQEAASWPHDVLELDSIGQTVELLFKVSVYAQVEKQRRLGGRVLDRFFKTFNRRGRFEFLRTFLDRHLFDRGDHAGANFICSYLIHLFKEELNECFSRQDPFYYRNQRFFSTLFNILFKNSKFKSTLFHFNLINNPISRLHSWGKFFKTYFNRAKLYKNIKNINF